MNLAYLVNQYPQPSQSFIRREIQALEALGHKVHRFTVRRWPGTLVDPSDQLERQSTRAILEQGLRSLLADTMAMLFRHPLRFLKALSMAGRLSRSAQRGLAHHLIYLAEACTLARWLQDAGVEHLHAHFGTNSASVALLCHLLGGPSWSFTAHGPEEFDAPRALHLGLKIRQAAFVVAITDFCRSQLFRWCPYGQWRKIRIVHCGLDGDFLDQTPTAIPGEAHLVNIGRLAEQKGQMILLDAAAQLAEMGVDFHLTLVGDGPLRGEIERKIAAHGLSGHITLAGWCTADEVRRRLQESRALVLPSFAEGLPVVIMEALALHRPVISTQIAGIPELVRDGETGWLIPPGNVEVLVQAMRKIIDAPTDELERMGQTGAQWVAQRHHAQTEATKLAELIAEHLVAQRRNP